MDGMYLWLTLLLGWVFVLGAAVGSFLNVCIYRLGAGKALAWPGSRCGGCFTAIPTYQNVPIVGYWMLRGRCPRCGATFSMRYFLVELFTGLAFVGLYVLEVGYNWQGYPAWSGGNWYRLSLMWFPEGSWPLFGAHALLASLLIVATGTLLDRGRIPQTLSAFGAMCGFVWAVCWPWPEPTSGLPLRFSPFPPGFVPLPGLAVLPPGSVVTGAMTGLLGLLVVPWLLRLVNAVHLWMRGRTQFGEAPVGVALIVGGFLGWQVALLALAVGAVCAAPLMIAQRRATAFPLLFLLAVVGTWLMWGQGLHAMLGPWLVSWGGPALLAVVGLGLVLLGLVVREEKSGRMK